MPEIRDELEFLFAQKKKQTDPLIRDRLKALCLAKSGKGMNYTQISEKLGYNRAAIRGWFTTYATKGLTGLLERKPGGKGRKSKIEILAGETGMAQINAWLSSPENAPNSFKELHLHLKDTYGIDLSYESVWRHFRLRKGASLKAARPSNVKKDPERVAAFQKNSGNLYQPFSDASAEA